MTVFLDYPFLSIGLCRANDTASVSGASISGWYLTTFSMLLSLRPPSIAYSLVECINASSRPYNVKLSKGPFSRQLMPVSIRCLSRIAVFSGSDGKIPCWHSNLPQI